jgi:hypothetical protein
LDLVEVTALPRLLELLIPLAEAPAKMRFFHLPELELEEETPPRRKTK